MIEWGIFRKSILFFLKTLSIIFVFVIRPALADKECLAVGGTKTKSHKDNPEALQEYVVNTSQNSLFTRDTLHLGKNINCKIFNGWDNLQKYLISNSGKPNFSQDKKILIVEYAHGSQGGLAECNKRDYEGDEIYFRMKKIASSYHTAFVMDSCYSGDLIAKKISDDEINTDSIAIDQMCLITTSTFNQASYADDSPIAAVNNSDIEHLSMLSFYQNLKSGLTSAAPWNGNGWTDTMTESYFSNGLSNLINYNKYGYKVGCTSSNVVNENCYQSIVDLVFFTSNENKIIDNKSIYRALQNPAMRNYPQCLKMWKKVVVSKPAFTVFDFLKAYEIMISSAKDSSCAYYFYPPETGSASVAYNEARRLNSLRDIDQKCQSMNHDSLRLIQDVIDGKADARDTAKKFVLDHFSKINHLVFGNKDRRDIDYFYKLASDEAIKKQSTDPLDRRRYNACKNF